jgi:hypothetical protein
MAPAERAFPGSITVIAGLKAAETGCNARIRAVNAAPVAMAVSSNCRPVSEGDSRLAAMPEPITAATKNMVPVASATSFR